MHNFFERLFFSSAILQKCYLFLKAKMVNKSVKWPYVVLNMYKKIFSEVDNFLHQSEIDFISIT